MNKFYQLFLRLLPVSLSICAIQAGQAQMIGTDIFLKGSSIEVGVHNLGFCGTVAVPPEGYHPRAPAGFMYAANRLGFVADPLLDGWEIGTPNYVGDYFVPGTPQEGWDIMADGIWNRAWGNQNNPGAFTTGAGPLLLTGGNVGYIEDGRNRIALWEGSMGNIAISKRTIVDTTKTFFIVRVELENTGDETISDVYYERTLDPDNEQRIPGAGSSYATNNKIVFQPNDPTVLDGDSGNKCLVTATGLMFPSVSYLGLGTVDCRAQAYVYTENALAPQHTIDLIHSGEGPASYIMKTDSGIIDDKAIGLIFSLGDMTPGQKVDFAYAYILRTEDLDSAFQRIGAAVNINNTSYGSQDTVYACPGSWVDIQVDGGNNYNWSDWLPSAGLENPSGGTTNRALVTDTITYSIIGQNMICDDFDTLSITIIPYHINNPGNNNSITICNNAPPLSLFDYLNGEPEPGGIWTGPAISPTGALVPSSLSTGTYEYIYAHNIDTCSFSATVMVEIIDGVDLDFDITYQLGCEEDTILLTALAEDLTYFRWNFGDGSAQDTSNLNPEHTYTEQGSYNVWFIGQNADGCLDSTMRIVNTVHPILAGFEQSIDSLCEEGTNIIAFYDRSVGNITTWQWDFGDGHTSTLQNPQHSYVQHGLYSIRLIVRDILGCSDTAYASVFVDQLPTVSVSTDKNAICNGESVNVTVSHTDNVQYVDWDFGDGVTASRPQHTIQHAYTAPGTYYIVIEVTPPVCPAVSTRDTVLVKPMPVINLGGDTSLCLRGEPILLEPATLTDNPPGTIYYWSTGDTGTVYTATAPGEYRVFANADGCTTSDVMTVNKDCYTNIPNSFTPNGDGNNDYFFPRQLLTEGIVDFKMEIYNRWGQKIFETNNPEGRGWDGKYNGTDQPSGVYVYQIAIRYKNQASDKYTGNITLLR